MAQNSVHTRVGNVEFLHKIGLSSQAIIGLEKVGEALKLTMEKTWGVFQRGTALEPLSKRTRGIGFQPIHAAKGFRGYRPGGE